jgi:hypothetical protein
MVRGLPFGVPFPSPRCVRFSDEKAIERAKGDCLNSEEGHRGNRFPVITEKGKPARGKLPISGRPFHPTRDRSLGDIKAEHEKLAMDTWSSPRWLLNDHPKDQLANLLRRPSSSNLLPYSRDQPPVQTKTGPVPATTVSGVTTMSACLHSDQKRRTTTQKSLSRRLGRGCRLFSTASCCRSTRFSKTRFPRLRKRRIKAPIQRKSRLNMGRSYTRPMIGRIVVSC